MFKIKKNKKGEFYVICLSTNGRTLWVTESFTQKPASWKNIKSTLRILKGAATVKVIDESTIEPVTYVMDNKGKKKVA